MRVVIIGAGISGLSMALHLGKYLPDSDILIVEGYKSGEKKPGHSASTFSGGLGVEVGPNGMRVLRRLSPSIHRCVASAGYPVDKFELRTAAGTLLGVRPVGSNTPTIERTVMIGRRDLWGFLKQAVERQFGDGVIREDCKILAITQRGNKVEMVLRDGEVLEADLVIGADGVRSAARKAVLEESESDEVVGFQNCMNIGGFVPTEYIQRSSNQTSANVVLTFGRSGFFGYTPCSTKSVSSGIDPMINSNQRPDTKSMWWFTFPDSPSTPQRTTTNNPKDPSLPARLRAREGEWTDPVIQAIVRDVAGGGGAASQDCPCVAGAKATLDVHTPTWMVRKLPRWAKGRVILIGDAAHALPSISAQGVSQALEDSATLSLLLAKSLKGSGQSNESPSPDSFGEVARRYESLRRPRAERILNEALEIQSKKAGLGWLGSKMVYFMMWLEPVTRDSWKYDYGVEEAVAQNMPVKARL